VYGSPRFNEATGQFHRSTHEVEKVMADEGFYPAGDPVGGARNVHRLNGTGFSYNGQPKRTSTGE
jgi:hypothetical protein